MADQYVVVLDKQLIVPTLFDSFDEAREHLKLLLPAGTIYSLKYEGEIAPAEDYELHRLELAMARLEDYVLEPELLPPEGETLPDPHVDFEKLKQDLEIVLANFSRPGKVTITVNYKATE